MGLEKVEFRKLKVGRAMGLEKVGRAMGLEKVEFRKLKVEQGGALRERCGNVGLLVCVASVQ